MSRIPTRLAALAACTALTLPSACGSDPENRTDGAEPVTLTASWTLSETSTAAEGPKAFAEYLERESDGRIRVEQFWSGALADSASSLQAVGSGVADVSFVAAVTNPSDLPVANWIGPLNGLLDPVPSQRVVGSVALTQLFADNEDLVAEYAKHGLVVLGVTNTNNQHLFCTQPVTSLDEAEGLRVRAAGTLWEPEYEALGMVLVALPTGGDQYEALQRGVIDCGAYPPLSAYDLGLLEVAPHLMPVPLTSTGGQLIFSQSALESLSTEDQRLVHEAGQAWLQAYAKANLIDMADVFGPGGAASGLGLQMHGTPELDEALLQQQTQNVDAMMANLPAGMSEADATALVAEFEELATRAAGWAAEAGFNATVPTNEEQFVAAWTAAGEPSLANDFYAVATTGH